MTTQKDPIRRLEQHDEFKQRPVYRNQRVAGEVIIAAFKSYNDHRPTVVKLVTESNEEITVEPRGDACSMCDKNSAPEIERGMPAKAAQAERANARCTHATAAANLPKTSPCECGCMEILQTGPAIKRLSPVGQCASCNQTM
jgi:hypothetical protein